MLILAYLGLLALIPLLVKKDDSEVQWHAKNGLALMVAFIGAALVLFIAQIGLSFAGLDIFGCLGSLVGCVVWIGYLIVTIIAIVKAVQGGRLVIPVISNFAGN